MEAIKSYFNDRLKFLSYINELHKSQSLLISSHHKIDIKIIKYLNYFISFNSLLASGVFIRRYPRM